jgi:hypothetical protein
MKKAKSGRRELGQAKDVDGASAAARGVSRRGFLKGAAAGAAIAQGAALLGGASTAVASTPQRDRCVDGEAAHPIPPVGPPAKWDKEADVVVVGTGGGGLAASVRAAEKRLKVITLEKLSGPGGGTKESALFFTFGGTRYQNAIKWAIPKFPYDPDALVELVMPAYQYSADKLLLRALATRGPECVDWMGDHGVEWELNTKNDPVFGQGGHIWKNSCLEGNYTRATKHVTDHMHAVAVRAGVEFLFGTTVTRLVQQGDRIVGVRTKNLEGLELFVRAKKAVVLAAGGFAVNRDMLQKYTPYANAGAGSSFGMPCDTGECTRMGIGAGADIAGVNSTSFFDGGVDWVHEGRGTFHQHLYNGSVQLARQPWLSIDITGERYQYMDSVPVDNLFHQPAVPMSRPGRRGYVIFDDNYETNVPGFEQAYCRRPLRPTMPNMDRVPGWLVGKDWREGVKVALDAGVIKKAQTIDALGEQLGFAPGVLARSVTKWNEACASRKDDPIYGYKPEWLIPIRKPPFYGIRMGGFLYATHAGLRVNPGMQVVSTKGTVIAGLYAAFHTAGGAIGENAVSGASILADNGLSWASGYIAANTIVDAGNS